MRLAEDRDSWKASGIIRRDFRHASGEPEVPRHRKKSKGKPRKKIDHKHVFVDVTGTPEDPLWELPDWVHSDWWQRYMRRLRRGKRVMRCADPLCDKVEYRY